MSMINYADWDKQITIPKMSGTEFINKYGEYLIRSFTAIKVEFTFPNNVVFPNLPVRLDKGSLMLTSATNRSKYESRYHTSTRVQSRVCTTRVFSSIAFSNY